ncbi:hypothetical protein B1L11_14185 [Microbispora sp. GKU 823]|nr:hypothetical protein B1L11_14185 [Microbispora sp. GKU 823]
MFAVAHQDWRRAIITLAWAAAALLVWWAAKPARRPAPVNRRTPTTARPSCTHATAVPVTSTVTGQVLAALCPACDADLPASVLTSSAAYAGLRADTAAIHGILSGLDTGPRRGCPHARTIDVTAMMERHPRRQCTVCGATWAETSKSWPAAMF